MFSAQELDQFFKTEFKKRIADRYGRLKIMTEGDLQVWTWYYLRRFLHSHEAFSRTGFRVFNQPYFKNSHIYPDLAIFKDGKPWALIELKKKYHLSVDAWHHEREKLLRADEVWRP